MDALPKAWTPFRFHAVQHALWTSSKRFAAVPAGRGSGKTALGKRRLVRYLSVQKPWADPRYFYGAPTVEQAKRIAWNDILALIPPEWIDGDPNRSELVIRTKFGSSLHVVGLDRPQRIEGVQWDGCVVDESCDIKPGTFDLNILPTLVWRSAWCWRIGVPKRFGVGAVEFRTYYEKCCRGEIPESMGYTWPSSDIISAEALAIARAKMDSRDFAEQFEAKFQSASGGIFYAFDTEYNVRPCVYHSNMPIIVGSDFNVNPMAWVLCHRYGREVDGNHRLEVFDMIWLRDANTPHTLRELKAKYGRHEGGFLFLGDATGRARKTSATRSDYQYILQDSDFKRMGRTVHYPKSNPVVADRFAAMNGLICAANDIRRLFISDRKECQPLVDDLMLRSYKLGSKEPADSGDIGHATDALGYVVHRLYPIRVVVDGKYEVAVTQG